jgi:hypothetical protein
MIPPYLIHQPSQTGIKSKKVELIFVSGELNVADINTKPLTGRSFVDKRYKMMKGFKNDRENIFKYVVNEVKV